MIELSNEHKTLPTSEILTCLKAEKISYKIIDTNEYVLAIETKGKKAKIKRLADRLSLSFYINEMLFSCPATHADLKKNAMENNIKNNGSIAVKYKKRSKNVDSQQVVKTLADVYSKGRKVTLKNPEIELRALITDSTVYVGLKFSEIDRSQFEKRKAQFRPFFSPISLHPKLARVMVNLSAIQPGEVLLDPFCGTGGVLIEAGLIGIKTIGIDIENKMVRGCKENLDFYKIKEYKLYCSDIREIHKHVSTVDAVTTDLPYGKSTTTKGENLSELYEGSFKNISSVLKENGRAVVGLPDKNMLSLGEKHFTLLEKHKLKVHKSLTRYFAVYQK